MAVGGVPVGLVEKMDHREQNWRPGNLEDPEVLLLAPPAHPRGWYLIF